MENSLNQDRPLRREYSKHFKAQVLDRCAHSGASVGGVLLSSLSKRYEVGWERSNTVSLR